MVDCLAIARLSLPSGDFRDSETRSQAVAAGSRRLGWIELSPHDSPFTDAHTDCALGVWHLGLGTGAP